MIKDALLLQKKPPAPRNRACHSFNNRPPAPSVHFHSNPGPLTLQPTCQQTTGDLRSRKGMARRSTHTTITHSRRIHKPHLPTRRDRCHPASHSKTTNHQSPPILRPLLSSSHRIGHTFSVRFQWQGEGARAVYGGCSQLTTFTRLNWRCPRG